MFLSILVAFGFQINGQIRLFWCWVVSETSQTPIINYAEENIWKLVLVFFFFLLIWFFQEMNV